VTLPESKPIVKNNLSIGEHTDWYVAMHNTDGYVALHMLHCTIRPYPLAKPINISGEHRVYCRPYALILHTLYRR